MRTAADYWLEVIQQSCEEHGVAVTDEQAQAIATDVQLSHENYGMAFYQPNANPLRDELDRVKRELSKERAKRTCGVCNGSGMNVSHGPVHSAYSQCWRCRGLGRVAQ